MQRTRMGRKACDLCYSRRIRCDSQQPRCSHCVLYNTECTRNACSRKAKSKAKSVIPEEVPSIIAQSNCLPPVEDMNMALNQSFPQETSDNINRQHQNDPSAMELPNLHDSMVMVESFIATFNSGLPLFDHRLLVDMLKAWYSDPDRRSPVTWAAINVVLAITSDQNNPYASSKATARYINNAQSMVTKVITGELGLLNVQVLLGLVLFFHRRLDWQPASILIASSLRLARQLRLHTRRSSEHLDPATAIQRNRVFWIAYILDKDISMQTHQPSIQSDWDINLDIPQDNYIDNSTASDGEPVFNFFRSRVELASIQGRLYDDLYSERSQLLSAAERDTAIFSLLSSLDSWYGRLPLEFRRQRLAEIDCPCLSRWFGILHSTGMVCLALISRSQSMDFPRVENSKENGKLVATGRPQLPLPPGWKAVVETARDMIRFYKSKDVSLIWISPCAFCTCLVYLVANNLCDPGHANRDLDHNLAESALEMLKTLAFQTGDERVSRLRDASAEFLQYQYMNNEEENRGVELNSLHFRLASYDVEYMLSGLSRISN